jgi:hypothetical protein
MKKNAKTTGGVGKRASKDDLAPRKSQDVKGGSLLGSIGKAIGGAVKSVAPAVLR